MIDRRWGWIVCALGQVAVARAEPGVLTNDSGSVRCEFLEAAQSCDGAADCPAGQECHDFGLSGQLCAPANSIFCCGDMSDCPVGSGGCHDVGSISGSGDGLCLPDETYCGDPSLDQILACHTLPRTNILTPAFGSGDCDRDGLSNASERAIPTDECRAPAPVGVATDSGCLTLPTGCTRGTPCTTAPGGLPATCAVTPDGNGTFCNPGVDALYCCDPQIVCPMDGDQCQGGRCIADDCAMFPGIDPAACISGPDGDPVPYPAGDCDEDGIPNGGDETQCGEAAFDAGIPSDFDAGSADGDAGSLVVEPRFNGGGGCACRMTQRSEAPWSLLVLALFVFRRRR